MGIFLVRNAKIEHDRTASLASQVCFGVAFVTEANDVGKAFVRSQSVSFSSQFRVLMYLLAELAQLRALT